MKYLKNFDIGKAQVFMHGYVFENCGREVGVCLKQIFIWLGLWLLYMSISWWFLLPYITEYRMVGAGRDLCGSPSPTPCWSRVTQSRLHRTASKWVLNISREGDSTASLGSLCQGSVTLRGKKFFLMFSWNFLCFSLCPLPLVLSLGTTEKSLAPSSWHPPFRYL